MVESNIGMVPKRETLKSSDLLVTPPISANVLLGTIVEEPKELPLAKSNILFYRFKANNVTEYVGVVDLNLRGLAFNHLLLSLAPYKGFALDTRDILNDWKAIDNLPQIKERHEAMGEPWSIFDRDRLFFREVIEKDYHLGSWITDSEELGLVPVIRWRVGYRNIRELVFDQLSSTEDKRHVEILKRHIPEYQDGMDIRFFNPTVGYFTVCHFSPEIKGDPFKWKKKDSYSSYCQNTQYIGATQVGAYAIKLADTIRKAPFYSRSEKYIRSTAQSLK